MILLRAVQEGASWGRTPDDDKNFSSLPEVVFERRSILECGAPLHKRFGWPPMKGTVAIPGLKASPSLPLPFASFFLLGGGKGPNPPNSSTRERLRGGLLVAPIGQPLVSGGWVRASEMHSPTAWQRSEAKQVEGEGRTNAPRNLRAAY